MVRPGDAYAQGFGAVYAGAAAKADNGVAFSGNIHFHGFFNICRSWVGYGSVIDETGNVIIGKRFLQPIGKAGFSDAFIGDNQHPAAVVFYKNFRNIFHAADNFGFPVRKKGQRDFQRGLKCSAI